ncbi:hypothetical protein Tco_0892984 [Tanacetum coccineum]|uniref:Uncharacterized protein n=1 Tax=Tanacetum coccineum TaxID=301880 RepID=A0ABQ5C965_9ASTR
MSTSTMDHFTPSPNEENNAFFRPLDGEARKYGDYVCFNVFEICEELRKNNPDLFDERKPKDIAMEIIRELEFENTDMISKHSIQLHDIGVITFKLHGSWIAKRDMKMFNDGIVKLIRRVLIVNSELSIYLRISCGDEGVGFVYFAGLRGEDILKCPPNKRYDLMDANKKVDLENFWHTLKEDGSKNRLKFLLDRKELTLTLDNFRTIFHLPQANDNNHASFVQPPSFSDMVPFYKQVLGFTMELKSVSNFKIPGVLHLCRTYADISNCLTTLLGVGPTAVTDNANAARDAYHYLQMMILNEHIFNSGRNKNKGTHRTTTAPRSPNPDTEPAESSVLKRSTVIRFRLPSRQSARLTPPAPVPTVEKADEMILQDTIQVKAQSDKESPEGRLFMKREETRKTTESEPDIVITFDASVRSYMSGHILHVHPAQVQSSSVPEQQHQLYLAMKADPLLQQQDIAIWLALRIKFEQTQNSVKRQKTSEYEAYVSRESSSGQDNVEELGPSTLGNQEQDDEFNFWTESYASDDGEIPTKQVSQDIMEEISLMIDEAKLKKMADEMLRQRCTSGDEHQYHIDQMKNFLQSDIVWESRKEILIGNSGPKKIILSLHKFPAIVFDDDDIEERTSIWVNKCIKKFNPYARYSVENWKNPHAKIFYIRRQKEPGRPKEEIYLNSKIVQVIKTFWELGHEHKFITEIVARRANGCIVSIAEPDYKNLNKNDIEDMSSVIWERVHDFQLGIESYQQKINLIAPTITFPGIKEYDVFSIVYVHGIIYTNSKKEKRVMRPSEIHKFCDATLRRTLEGLKSYYNDVKFIRPIIFIVSKSIGCFLIHLCLTVFLSKVRIKIGTYRGHINFSGKEGLFFISINECKFAVEKRESNIVARVVLSDGKLPKTTTYRNLSKLLQSRQL